MITVAESINRASLRFGSSVAIVDGARTLTFSETNLRSSRLANALLTMSPEPGARVALLLKNCLEYVECDFAVVKSGKVRVAINPRLVDHERRHILSDSGAETLIFDGAFAGFALDAAAELPALRNLIALGDPVSGAHEYEEVLTRARPDEPRVERHPDDPNYIMYTSGTSGKAKGATVTCAGRMAGAVNMLLDEVDPGPGDGMLHVGSMCHGSGSKVLAYYLRGARNVTLPRFEPETFFETVVQQGITGSFVVPTMIGMLLESSRGRDIDTGRLRHLSYGGAPITPARLREALERFGNIFVQVYGSCEAPHPVMVLGSDDHRRALEGAGDRLTSVGREATLVETRLVGAEGGSPPEGEPGELWVKGPNVMSGYWNNQEATDQVFDGAWYKTGDVAVRDSAGFHYIVDRMRDVVITGGLNVYPAEVEAVIGSHPDVHDVAVIGVPDEQWGESVKAVVVLRPGSHVDESELIRLCSEQLAGYKKPRTFDFVNSLPVGSTGKVLKRELAAQYWNGRDRRVN